MIYDVLGDVVCGGFSMPLREGIAEDVYLVTTADFMSLYAANNICRGIARYAREGTVRLSGVIYNGRSGQDDPALAARFARAVGTELTGILPMDGSIGQAERQRKTVVEAFPESEAAACFRALADRLLAGGVRCVPTPIEDDELEALCLR